MKKMFVFARFQMSCGVSAVSLLSFTAFAQRGSPQAADAVQESQSTHAVGVKRPEQHLSPHDQSDAFKAPNASPSSTVFKTQPDEGEVRGFDFARDPLNAQK